jgi:hypothetical protein
VPGCDVHSVDGRLDSIDPSRMVCKMDRMDVRITLPVVVFTPLQLLGFWPEANAIGERRMGRPFAPVSSVTVEVGR